MLVANWSAFRQWAFLLRFFKYLSPYISLLLIFGNNLMAHYVGLFHLQKPTLLAFNELHANIKLSFISMASHLGSPRNRGLGQLRNGQFVSPLHAFFCYCFCFVAHNKKGA